ncbi:hypothetical protein CQA53_10280, partial [Helicobacter didelphidarum]
DSKINAYHVYSDTGKGSSRKVTKDRVTSIELKMVESRLRLKFDGQTLCLLENERKLGEWEARSGTPLSPIDTNKESKRNRFKIRNKDKFYYYDDETHKKQDDKIHTDSSKPMAEGNYNVTLSYDKEQLNILNIDLLGNQKDICTLFNLHRIPQDLSIPLKVKYQKRVLIIIERFQQTLESTKARMNIYIDGKRVNSNGNIIGEKTGQYEYFNPLTTSQEEKDNPYAYILDRPGPDTIAGEVKLRIPSGRYDVEWHKNVGNIGAYNQNVLNLKNNFVDKNRNILIHNGDTKATSPKNSDGCLIIAKEEAKSNGIVLDNVLKADSSKKHELTKAIKKIDDKIGFIDKFLYGDNNKTNHSSPYQVVEHIEIRVMNNFPQDIITTQSIPMLSKEQERKQSIIDNTPAIFNIEGYERGMSSDIPWYQKHDFEEVTENQSIIDRIVCVNTETSHINHNRLVKAIIYLESTHGYYDAYYPWNKSFRPMNVNYDYWIELAKQMNYTKEQVKNNKEINILMGYELVKRIIARLENPTIEKIGTLYNALAKERNSSYGAVLRYYYDNQTWLKPKPPTFQDLIDYMRNNPPATKGF